MMFVFDLDGTLLNSQKTISPRNRTAVQSLYKQGYKIVIATARPPRSIDEKLKTLKIEHDTIYYNGAMIRSADGKIRSHVIKNSILNELYEFLYARDKEAVLTIGKILSVLPAGINYTLWGVPIKTLTLTL